MSKKTIFILLIIVIITMFIVGTILLSKKEDKTNTISPMRQSTDVPQNNQPIAGDEKSLKSCAESTVCEEGYFCYKSRYGAMGENGPVTGEEQGDSLCHKKCINDSDCSTGECLDVEIMIGDLVFNEKFCSEE